MSNINNLTNKIIEDAKLTAKKLVDEAEIKRKNEIDKKISEAKGERNLIISRAKDEAKIMGERIISNAQLQVRNMKLASKGQVIDDVFNKALVKLNSLSDMELLKFMKESILSLDLDGDEKVIVDKNNKAVTAEFIMEINEALKAKGKLGSLTLGYDENINGGYLIIKNGIEINNTFESLIKSLRSELETEVASALFN